MNHIEPLELDRKIARAARAERAWWRVLRADADRAIDDAWYEPFRDVTTRTTFQAVLELPTTDPLRSGLLVWVKRLAQTRIARTQIVAVAKARQDPVVRLEKPEPGLHGVRAIVRRVLTDPERARVFIDGLAAGAPPLLVHEKTLREAVREITLRLGDDGVATEPLDRGLVREEASRFLRRSDDLASSLFGRAEDLAGLVAIAVARDVPGVWPTKPDARWLFEQFQASPLVQGLTLELGSTPEALGASSFARALARFGAAYGRAAVLGGAPFVISRDPSELHPLRRGALFAALVADPLFLRKNLSLSRDAAAKTARAVAATFLASQRIAATFAATDITTESPDVVAERMEDALKVRILPELGGILPRPPLRAVERFAATLLAQSDLVTLRERFDDDWFRNPRALLFLRETDAAPRSFVLPPEALRGAAERLAETLEACGG